MSLTSGCLPRLANIAFATYTLGSVDYPFVDRDGRVWAVALSAPLGWEERRLGIRHARERLVQRVAQLKEPENRRGQFRSYQHGFSFGNGRTVSASSKAFDRDIFDFKACPLGAYELCESTYRSSRFRRVLSRPSRCRSIPLRRRCAVTRAALTKLTSG